MSFEPVLHRRNFCMYKFKQNIYSMEAIAVESHNCVILIAIAFVNNIPGYQFKPSEICPMSAFQPFLKGKSYHSFHRKGTCIFNAVSIVSNCRDIKNTLLTAVSNL